MLFNSYTFILLFLPVVFLGFFLLGRASHMLAALWLGLASLFFYGWWNPKFLWLLLASITCNYVFGFLLARSRVRTQAKALLVVAIVANIGALAYFKYADFFLSTVNTLSGNQYPLLAIILPLGISFFTFTQLVFLIDVYRGVVREYNFIHYLLFVTYFPHLIAGPLLHHRQMMPQFASPETYRITAENVAIGLAIFTIGLAKKVLLADYFGEIATPVFDRARDGLHPHLIAAWTAALAYTLQLYFDFSGYSDMAIGISRLFGIQLPINFNSPYKSQNIIEFWRRWHMTLSRFLRDYLYIPLGGNRLGKTRRFTNLMITMLLGGLWHGAGWTFVLWGALHGFYLVINHGFHALRIRLGRPPGEPSPAGRILGVAVTFLAVVVAWVVFRADSVRAAVDMLQGMAAVHGISGQGMEYIFQSRRRLFTLLVLLPVGLAIVWLGPNTQTLFNYGDDERDTLDPVWIRWTWRPSVYAAVALGVLFGFAVGSLYRPTQFIYFQF